MSAAHPRQRLRVSLLQAPGLTATHTCAVNDVANVNIDAKLIRSNKNKDRDGNVNTTADLADTIELQNGCACVHPACHASDALLHIV